MDSGHGQDLLQVAEVHEKSLLRNNAAKYSVKADLAILCRSKAFFCF